MIKDIVVNLSVPPAHDVAGEFAVSIAAAFQAHLTALAFVYDPISPVISMARVPPDLIDTLRRQNEAAARETIVKCDRLANRTGLASESRAVDATFVGASDLFGRIARRFDLSVVGQAEPHTVAPEELIVEAALFESGRPVVVVPYIQRDGMTLDRVMVCWDGGSHAARAIGDALPFLTRAKTVELVIVANEPGKGDALPGADLAQHLARHGVKVEVDRIISPDLDVASTLLSHAADFSADFMVMGGYGHSRLREFILGGATRGILASMTVPTLMSH